MRASPASLEVIRGYYVIAGLYTLSAALIWGVNTLFLLDAGLSVSAVFIANGAFSAGMVVFEIPTGVIADTLGRRTSFLLSVSVLAATTLAYVGLAEVGAGVVEFSAVSVLMGLGFTFYSGAVESWLVDALAVTGYDDELDHVFARGQIVTGAGMLVGTVGGGLLGSIDLSIPFLARSGLLALVFAVAFIRMHDLGFEAKPLTLGSAASHMSRVTSDSITFGWHQRGLRLLMLAGFVQTAVVSWGFYAWQPYFLDLLESDAVWIAGVVSALIALSTMVGNGVVEWFTRYCGRRTTLLLCGSGAIAAAAVVVGAASSFFVALPALLLMTASLGVMGPVRQSYFHRVIPTQQRATVVSFDSMVSGIGGAGGQTALGAIAQRQSFSTGYVVGGATAVIALPFLFAVRRLGGPADQILGERAGLEGACAAQGIPAVSAVDASPPEPASLGQA